jgi:hypothetical protein
LHLPALAVVTMVGSPDTAGSARPGAKSRAKKPQNVAVHAEAEPNAEPPVHTRDHSRRDIEDALSTLNIHVNDREWRLLMRDVDTQFIDNEKREQAAAFEKRRALRLKKRRQKADAGVHGPLSPSSKFTQKVRLVKATHRVLSAMNPAVSLNSCLHKNSRHQKVMMSSTHEASAARGSEDERQQELIRKSIARVKARKKLYEQRLVETYNLAIALSGREPGSPRATDRHGTDHEELALIFKEIDEDNSGYLDKEEIGQLSERLGKKLSKVELGEAMLRIDEDRSGAVGLDEFEVFWR